MITYDERPETVLHWNISAHPKEYFVAVTPPVESGSNFITSNTTIQLPVLYNQEYNISVVASNCAGNSTPASITVFYGK